MRLDTRQIMFKLYIISRFKLYTASHYLRFKKNIFIFAIIFYDEKKSYYSVRNITEFNYLLHYLKMHTRIK